MFQVARLCLKLKPADTMCREAIRMVCRLPVKFFRASCTEEARVQTIVKLLIWLEE